MNRKKKRVLGKIERQIYEFLKNNPNYNLQEWLIFFYRLPPSRSRAFDRLKEKGFLVYNKKEMKWKINEEVDENED